MRGRRGGSSPASRTSRTRTSIFRTRLEQGREGVDRHVGEDPLLGESSMSADKTSVTVRIAGEEHTIRASAEPSYTRKCAGAGRRAHPSDSTAGRPDRGTQGSDPGRISRSQTSASRPRRSSSGSEGISPSGPTRSRVDSRKPLPKARLGHSGTQGRTRLACPSGATYSHRVKDLSAPTVHCIRAGRLFAHLRLLDAADFGVNT